MNKNIVPLRNFRETDMVCYLYSIGHEPVKIRGNDYWYLSPLRHEKTASFKVNRFLNCWYDHGIGKGGTLFGFARLLGQLVPNHTRDILQSISTCSKSIASQPVKILTSNTIEILQVKPITSSALLQYIHERKITEEIASHFCRQVHYKVNDKTYYSIGFKNDAGGYELRNRYCKNSTHPKAITTIRNGRAKIAVFEGFFDFLSLIVLFPQTTKPEFDFCILNSLSLFESARFVLEQYQAIHLYLDNDRAGQNCCGYAASLHPKYIDESGRYHGNKDVNEWLIEMHKQSSKPLIEGSP